MVVQAYILVQTNVGKAAEVAAEIGDISGVTLAEDVTGPYDVIATNVHCLPTRTAPNCDARAFWVSGLAGRRVLVEGWGYTDAAQAANGRGGLGFARQPFDDPALLALNDGVFTDPTAEKASKLCTLGVRWLFADRRAGTVSPDLADVASLQFRSGPVSVYRLTAPAAVTTR